MDFIVKGLAVVGALFLTACVFVVSADGEAFGHTKSLNRGIHLADGSTSDDVASINGGIQVGDNATVEDIDSVNGDIEVGKHSQVGEISSVNGDIELAQGVKVLKDIQAVNGGIELAEAVDVRGSVELINGHVQASAAQIHGKIETVNASLDLRDGTQVAQGLHVRKPGRHSADEVLQIFLGENVVIGDGSVFDRPVEIFKHPSAQLGDYTGDAVSIRDYAER